MRLWRMKTLPRVASGMALRAGLQSDSGHEHHEHSPAHGSDERLVKTRKRLLNATRPKRFDTSSTAFLHNQDPERTFTSDTAVERQSRSAPIGSVE